MDDLIHNLSLHKIDGDQRPVHVVAVPYPAQGHTVPLMQLCKQLATLGGFTITFVNTEHIHARMLKADACGFEEDGELQRGNNPQPPGNGNIRLVSIPGGLPPELHVEAEHVEAAYQASEALSQPFEKLLEKLNHEGPPVTHIISDAMMSWTQYTADKLDIPRLAFWTSSAAVYYVFWHMYDLALKGTPCFKAAMEELIHNKENMVSWIPGLPAMDFNDLPSVVQSDGTDFIYQFVMRQLQPLQRAACILINTFYELEGPILSVIQHMSTGPPILAIGPLLPFDAIGLTNCKPISIPLDQNGKPISIPSDQNGKLSADVGEMLDVGETIANNHVNAQTAVRIDGVHSHIRTTLGANGFHSHIGGSIFEEDAGCLQWLDSRSRRSVLYISFGSLFRMREEQFKELAAGVEASGAAFLWSIRPDFVQGGSYADKLPESFLERTRERGMMMPWVPQLRVLSHPSIGGFLTHCGWNSNLESVCMGVPMLCWPDAGERRTNGLLAITLWQTGLDFTLPKPPLSAHTTNCANIISRHEVERVIKVLIGGDPSSPSVLSLRSKAAALRHAALLSLCQGGSSSQAVLLLLTHMMHHLKGPFHTGFLACP